MSSPSAADDVLGFIVALSVVAVIIGFPLYLITSAGKMATEEKRVRDSKITMCEKSGGLPILGFSGRLTDCVKL